MIQSGYNKDLTLTQTINLNLWDSSYFQITFSIFSQQPLVQIISQQTGKSKVFRPFSTDITNKERYVSLTYYTNISENLENGIISFGSSDFPFGFYDLQIFAPTSASMSLVGVNYIYTGLFNIYNVDKSVEYKEYTTNDTDTDSVYITN
tara:strand:+ start:127 stop:573 length:447 start_codon:yes stop_codon:yes gene_type:complete